MSSVSAAYATAGFSSGIAIDPMMRATNPTGSPTKIALNEAKSVQRSVAVKPSTIERTTPLCEDFFQKYETTIGQKSQPPSIAQAFCITVITEAAKSAITSARHPITNDDNLATLSSFSLLITLPLILLMMP